MSENYSLLNELNLCHRCQKAICAPNRKYCPECLEKIAQYNAEHYSSEKAHKYQKRRKEIYYHKKEHGICVRCTKKATHGIYCYECSINAKKRNKKMAEKRKKQRHERGLIPEIHIKEKLCLRCGKPVENDKYKLCNRCVQQNIEILKSADKSYYQRLTWHDFEKMKGNIK